MESPRGLQSPENRRDKKRPGPIDLSKGSALQITENKREKKRSGKKSEGFRVWGQGELPLPAESREDPRGRDRRPASFLRVTPVEVRARGGGRDVGATGPSGWEEGHVRA